VVSEICERTGKLTDRQIDRHADTLIPIFRDSKGESTIKLHSVAVPCMNLCVSFDSTMILFCVIMLFILN